MARVGRDAERSRCGVDSCCRELCGIGLGREALAAGTSRPDRRGEARTSTRSRIRGGTPYGRHCADPPTSTLPNKSRSTWEEAPLAVAGFAASCRVCVPFGSRCRRPTAIAYNRRVSGFHLSSEEPPCAPAYDREPRGNDLCRRHCERDRTDRARPRRRRRRRRRSDRRREHGAREGRHCCRLFDLALYLCLLEADRCGRVRRNAIEDWISSRILTQRSLPPAAYFSRRPLDASAQNSTMVAIGTLGNGKDGGDSLVMAAEFAGDSEVVLAYASAGDTSMSPRLLLRRRLSRWLTSIGLRRCAPSRARRSRLERASLVNRSRSGAGARFRGFFLAECACTWD
jgi:hypothetical protein